MRALRAILGAALAGLCAAPAFAESPDLAAVERGRKALTERGYVRAAWSEKTYREVGKLWGPGAPDPEKDPEGYARAFESRYGLHPAPFDNDGLPLGLRRGVDAAGKKSGITGDCMLCHGGSIGGKSYVGLGNTQLDLKRLGEDLTRAEGRRPPPSPFVVNSARGTNNAGMVAAVLLSVRNRDFSARMFPLPLGVNLPELDTPPWWNLGKKRTQYYDGRTDAESHRTNMQFLMGEKTLDEFKALEPTFKDIQAYLKSLKPPAYPFAVDRPKADRGRVVFEANCTKCHGTYGPGGEYPNEIVELKVIGTDPARALGVSDRSVSHYNATWLGELHPVDPTMIGYQAPPLDGIWASPPYLHNGSVPTLSHLLNSPTRPSRFKRPPSTDFAHYDKARVGWTFELVDAPETLTVEERHSFYDTARFGLGNGGHTFGDKLTDAERNDLIEYLKTL